VTVLAPLLRTRTSAVWLVLTLATVLSWALGHNHGGHTLTALAIIVIAIVKVRFVGLYFMELRAAPIALHGIFEAYCAAVGLTLAVLYLLT
jgi:Prokaryotic Cytochrome C oxidase subunit IV